jgi:Flp pilus assembly protein TadD
MQYGDQARRAGQLDEALYHYIQALQLDGRNSEALYRIGLIHVQRQNLTLADRALRSALAVTPEHTGALEASGLLYLTRNDYEQAKTVLQRALEADLARTGGADSLQDHDQRSPARAYNGLGVIADLNGEHERARALYQASLAIRAGSAEVLNNLGYSHYLQEEWPAAERLFRQALQQDPKFSLAWRNLGLLYTRQQRYDAALGAFEQIMESAEAHNDIGYICLLDGRYRLAETYFNKALTLSPVYYKKAQENLTLAQRMQQNSISQR